MLSYIRKKLGIIKIESNQAAFEQRLKIQQDYIKTKVAELKAYTRVDADVGIRGNNTIILTGIYRNRAYVHFYDMGDGEFNHLVEMLRHMNDHALIRHIDAPPNFRGIFEL